ncbi:MAG: hypothetical protein ACRDE8_12715, partial [Ginsengibacter sp.]
MKSIKMAQNKISIKGLLQTKVSLGKLILIGLMDNSDSKTNKYMILFQWLFKASLNSRHTSLIISPAGFISF